MTNYTKFNLLWSLWKNSWTKMAIKISSYTFKLKGINCKLSKIVIECFLTFSRSNWNDRTIISKYGITKNLIICFAEYCNRKKIICRSLMIFMSLSMLNLNLALIVIRKSNSSCKSKYLFYYYSTLLQIYQKILINVGSRIVGFFYKLFCNNSGTINKQLLQCLTDFVH